MPTPRITRISPRRPDFGIGAPADPTGGLGASQTPETSAPATVLPRLFTPQSYYDSTLLQKAILAQPAGSLIVTSTMKEEQTPGYAVGLHPSSQTPVAVEFVAGGQQSGSQVIYLKPGQIMRPHGGGAFNSIRWGLPFGWLGGGLATLYVFQTAQSEAFWPGNPEIVFHRIRMKIGTTIPAGVTKNWPLRFPWPNAVQGSSSIPQIGKAVLSVEPTKVIMRLRVSNLAAAAEMRIVFRGLNDFDLDSTGTAGTTDKTYHDAFWPSNDSAALGTYPIISLPDHAVRLAADDGGIDLVDITAGTPINAAYVDIERWGRL